MKRILLITLSVIVVIATGVYLYVRNTRLKDLEPYFKQKVGDLVTKASGGLYHLSIDTLETNVVNSKLILVNAHLYPDTAVYAQMEKEERAPNDLFEVTVHQLAINEIMPSAFVDSKTIDLGRLFIDHPVIKVWHKKQPYNIKEPDSTKTLYQLIEKDVKRIRIDTIMLNNIDLVYTNRGRQNRETRLSNVKMFFADILVDSSTQYDRSRFFFSKTGLVSLSDYTMKTSDSLYQLRIPSIRISTHLREIAMDSLRFKARISTRDYYKRVKFSRDYYDVAVNRIVLSDVDWWSSMAEESLQVHKLTLENGTVSIFKDRNYPGDGASKQGKYPHQLFMKSSLPVRIDSLVLNRIDLSYKELNPKSGETGTVLFSRLAGTVANATNMPEEVQKDGSCRVQLHTRFMNKADLKIGLRFDLAHYRKGNFSLAASLGAMDGTDLNPVTIPLGLVKINGATIRSLDASIQGNNYGAKGTVKFLYNGLNITVLKDDGDTVKKRGLLSFIANNFVLKKENPRPGQPERVEPAFYQRDATKSFFNMAWKTIFTGVGKTIGYKVKK